MLRIALAFLAVLVGLACATSPTGRSQFILLSDSQVDQMGLQAFDQLKQQTPISQDPAVQRYVTCIGEAIAAELPGRDGGRSWEIVVFDDAAANAFALPGGKIGVYTGLLQVAVNQDQVAAVMGHEVAHVLARHSNERVSQNLGTQTGLNVADILLQTGGASAGTQQAAMAALGLGAQFGVLMPYGRTQESEADELGLEYMARAGFDPRESVELWKNMMRAGGAQGPEFLSTHPSHETRIRRLYEHMAKALELQKAARAAGKRPACQ